MSTPNSPSTVAVTALYVVDSGVVFQVRRAGHRRPDMNDARTLGELINSSLASSQRLRPTFRIVELRSLFEIGVDPDWVVYEAEIDSALTREHCRRAVEVGTLPGSISVREITSRLLLHENGVLLLEVVVPAAVSVRGPEDLERSADVVGVIMRFLDTSPLVHDVRSVLGDVASRVHTGGRERFGHYYVRSRDEVSAEVDTYPTFFVAIGCQTDRWDDWSAGIARIAREVYLDRDELRSVLPSFEPDYLVIGYNGVLLLQASHDGTTPRRDPVTTLRILTAFHLALWKQLNVTDIEAAGCLTEIRELRHGRASVPPRERVRHLRRLADRVSRLRSDLEGMGREVSLQSVSNWVTDIRTLRAFRKEWLMSESLDSLRRDLDSLHHELIELEQGALTRAASVFAATGVASLFVASLTLLFTQTQTEQQPVYGWIYLGLKVAILIAMMAPSVVLLTLWRPWFDRVQDWLMEREFRR